MISIQTNGPKFFKMFSIFERTTCLSCIRLVSSIQTSCFHSSNESSSYKWIMIAVCLVFILWCHRNVLEITFFTNVVLNENPGAKFKVIWCFTVFIFFLCLHSNKMFLSFHFTSSDIYNVIFKMHVGIWFPGWPIRGLM